MKMKKIIKIILYFIILIYIKYILDKNKALNI